MHATGLQPQRASDSAPLHDERHRPEQTTLYRLVQQHALMIRVQCQRVVTMIDGKPVVDYIEEPNPPSAKGLEQRLLKSGTFALQGHDPGSKVHFRNVNVRVG